jgi:Methyltransferase domain
MGHALRERLGGARQTRQFVRRWGFAPPPPWSDTLGYEVLLEEIERHRLDQVDGDVLEIGSLLGGGTVKLCRWFARNAEQKRVITVDVFDIGFDRTETADGWPMPDLYADMVGDRDQRDVFDEVTQGCSNLVVVAGDSAQVELPTERLAFAFVDGNHDTDHVRSDFERTWERLSPGGIVAFHDYGGDLPGVTQALHESIGRHAAEIARTWTRTPMLLFLQRGD